MGVLMSVVEFPTPQKQTNKQTITACTIEFSGRWHQPLYKSIFL